MAAIDLNTIRKTIEERLLTELNEAPTIPVVFINMPFELAVHPHNIRYSVVFDYDTI